MNPLNPPGNLVNTLRHTSPKKKGAQNI